jgi:hypothetical protein
MYCIYCDDVCVHNEEVPRVGVLAFDEMTIRGCLMFSASTGKLVGFADSDDAAEQD